MKARVKATGEVIEIIKIEDNLFIDSHYYQYEPSDIEWEISDNDYWTRLEHQYAGMAMQTMLATLYNPKYHKELMACYTEVDAEEVARLSKYYAHALVEKLKLIENDTGK